MEPAGTALATATRTASPGPRASAPLTGLGPSQPPQNQGHCDPAPLRATLKPTAGRLPWRTGQAGALPAETRLLVEEGWPPGHLHASPRGGRTRASTPPPADLLPPAPSSELRSRPFPGCAGLLLASVCYCPGAGPACGHFFPFPQPLSGGNRSGRRLSASGLLGLQVTLHPPLLLLSPSTQVGF